MNLQKLISQTLEDRNKNGALRELDHVPEDWVDFSSNDYLGLGKVKYQLESMASGGSRLITGNSSYAEKLETNVSRHHGSECSLIFSNGYAANVGLVSAFAMRGVHFLVDEKCHASIFDGLRMGQSKVWKFKHNDFDDFESKLKKTAGNIIVITESLFSMDGDIPNFDQYAELKERFGFYFIVDETHSSGIYSGAKTYLESVGKDSLADLRLVGFGKGFGAAGAAVLCSTKEREFLINYARSFIYSTAPDQVFYYRIQRQYQVLQTDESRIENLWSNIEKFTSRKHNKHLRLSQNQGPIQHIHGPKELLTDLIAELKVRKIWSKLMLPPTIPSGEEKIRICLHSFNTEQEMELLFTSIEELESKH